jgi:hypothetical protein
VEALAWLLMKWPNSRPWSVSHACAVAADSGAGPYCRESKISETLQKEME